jgi:peptidoglycan/xylan/chitin deacetylase (PgdA/CDA1 family)
MLSAAEVGELRAAGMEIGGHTHSHPILTRIDAGRARREIGENKERLEGILGERITSFAYPNGQPRIDYAAEHVDLVRTLGYAAAASTARGTNGPRANPLELARCAPWDKAETKFMLRAAAGYFRNGASVT